MNNLPDPKEARGFDPEMMEIAEAVNAALTEGASEDSILEVVRDSISVFNEMTVIALKADEHE